LIIGRSQHMQSAFHMQQSTRHATIDK